MPSVHPSAFCARHEEALGKVGSKANANRLPWGARKLFIFSTLLSKDEYAVLTVAFRWMCHPSSVVALHKYHSTLAAVCWIVWRLIASSIRTNYRTTIFRPRLVTHTHTQAVLCNILQIPHLTVLWQRGQGRVPVVMVWRWPVCTQYAHARRAPVFEWKRI